MTMMPLDSDIKYHLDAKNISHYEAWRAQTGRDYWKGLQERHVNSMKKLWAKLTHEMRCKTIVVAIMSGEEGRKLVSQDREMLKFLTEHQDELVALRKQLQEEISNEQEPL